MYFYMCLNIYVCIYMTLDVRVYICVYIYTCVYIYVCISIEICEFSCVSIWMCKASWHPLFNAASGKMLLLGRCCFLCGAFASSVKHLARCCLHFSKLRMTPGYCESSAMTKPKMLFYIYMCLSYENVWFANIH